MDVTFSNVLEGTRQYFQGLPASTGSTASPAYSAEGHLRNDSEQNNEMPPSSSGYWPPPQDPATRPPSARELTPIQRPPSHHPEAPRPTSHTNVYMQNIPIEASNRQYQPQGGYQEHPVTSQHQSFQFSRPQSREAPSNFSQHQQQQYPTHIPSSSPYHQSPTPQQQQPRQELIVQPQTSQDYHNYPQSRSYFPAQTQPKPVPVPSNNSYKQPTSSQSYPTHSQQNASYYKHIYSSSQSPSQNVQHNPYANSSRPTSAHQDPNHQHNLTNSNMQNDNLEQVFRTTHNLPPIAPLSVNYHSSRLPREPSRPNSSGSSRQRTLSSSSSSSQPPSSLPSSSTASIIQQNPARLATYSDAYHNNYRNVPSSYTPQQQQQQPQQQQNQAHVNQNYQYSSTATTQSYNNVVMTSSTSAGSYTAPIQSQSSNQYYHPSKSNLQVVPNRSQPVVNHQPHVPQNVVVPPQNMERVNVNVNGSSPAVNKTKRESPLDLSVKTVRTPADSTLDDADNDARNKYYAAQAQRVPSTHSSISTHNYPTYDVSSFQRNIQRSTQSASAPKVEFHPNFNVPQLNHHQQLQHHHRLAETQQRPLHALPEKAHNKNRSVYEKNVSPYQAQSSSLGRYPTVSIPSAGYVNQFIQQNQHLAKKQVNNVPRMDFPNPASQGHKSTTALYPPQDAQKKRTAEVMAPVVPNKVPKIDSWRQTIDEQIEQRFSNYQQQKQQKYTPVNKASLPNGNYQSLLQEKSKGMPYSAYQKPAYENLGQHPSYSSSSHYNPHSNHNQTYVPSPATHQYPGYAGYTQQQNPYLHASSRSNSNPSLPTMSNTNKTNLGGAADKRVLSLLRNSLEVKEQKKLEQLKSNEHLLQQPRSDVQHPSTDVTAPLQPKPAFISRNNVSPFTPTNFPDGNTNLASMYKFHLPRAIDSVIYEPENKTVPSTAEKQMLEDNHTVITNHTSANNSDYDGLAAFLAARIRTKGELKQVGPTQNASNNNTSTLHLQGIIEIQLKSPMKQDSSQSSAFGSSTSSNKTGSPPKLVKERAGAFAPRRRLFSKTEDDPGNNNVPPRDKSGMRSSSETSVFDFPDSDSENEMPVLERQSLEAMRKGRKSSLKTATSSSDIKMEASSRPPSPEDDMFSQLCDNFVEQLKNGTGKKRTRRKKGVEPEVLAKLETVVTKEKPLDATEVSVKIEVIELPVAEEVKLAIGIESSTPTTCESKAESLLPLTDEKIDDDDVIVVDKRQRVRRRILSSSESSDSELETKVESNKALEKIKVKEEADEEKKTSDSSQKPNNKVPPFVRPAKKPSFGDGSDFYPGWEEGVYKYKKSLRMPPSLIQVTRPPQCHRLSTSLPDLDPYPNSPTPSSVTDNTDFPPTTKNRFKKIKSEPIDSDTESSCSFNLFSKHNNYDSEGSSSIKSLPTTTKEGLSILDKLLEKYGARKRKKYKKKEDNSPKVIPKSENPLELLATPSLEVSQVTTGDKKLSTSVIKSESPLLGFRKKTINNFKDAFKNSKNMVGLDKFATVVLKSRTRKQNRVLKQRVTIKEVFGEDRPASAPPVTCLNDIQVKEEIIERETDSCAEAIIVKKEDISLVETEKIVLADTKQVLKNKLLSKGRKKNNLLKTLVDKKLQSDIRNDLLEVSMDNTLDEVIIKRDPDRKSETPSIDGDEGSVTGKKRSKLRNIRRKFSSGFDYIRKKKKVKKEIVDTNDTTVKPRRRGALPKASPESVQDIQKEIKTWVLNKGIGETHLHRSARLGYTDITAYCLEKMECLPSPKDNAGYTPLHEACHRGHLDIAKLLLLFGANPSDSAHGGIRPLHEAVENGFVEIVRLLLSYGADPTLATYSGLTPLSLANDEATRQLLLSHLGDVQGESGPLWHFSGPASCFETNDLGYNILDDVPEPDPESELEDIEFEMSDTLLPNLYTLRGEAANDRWVLLQDLSNMLKIKSRDALLKQIIPSASTSSGSLPLANHKTILRELKMSDFLEQAHCCQFLNAGEKINTRASKIALVKYTDKVRELLRVDNVLIQVR